VSTPLLMFLIFIAITLAVTWWAARQSSGASAYFAAGRRITAWQNGIAVAGDYMSAASFLGIAGIIAFQGYDGFMYSVGWLVAYLTVLLIVAEPLRNTGKYTMGDVLAFRLRPRPVRAMASLSTLTVSTFYMIAQMVGAGTLVTLLLKGSGITYNWAVIIVGVLMVAYVVFGGMLATTWVQIIKAVLLISGATILVFMILRRFDFSPSALFGRVNENLLMPLDKKPLDRLSLGLALMFGTAGLPHILMRFYTVPDAKEARKSVFYATGWIGYFYILTFTIGFGASVLVGMKTIDANGGINMAAPLLAKELGGDAFFGFLSAVAFATILAVVAGLALAGASALSHDLYVGVIKKGVATEKEQVMVARVGTITLGVLAVLLGIVFEKQNVAYLVGLAFAVAASANFPALLMSVVWRKFTTAGAVASTVAGLSLAFGLIIVGPDVWVKVFHNKEAIFPLENPAIISFPAAFIAGIVASLLTPDPVAQAKFDDEKLRTYAGIGAD
jgi:cation/acetate symporter